MPPSTFRIRSGSPMETLTSWVSQYESMQAWVNFGLQRAADYRHPTRWLSDPEPAPHEQYLWDIGFHWGEWCEPDSDPGPILRGEADVAEVATAYLYRSLRALPQWPSLIGRGSRCGALSVPGRECPRRMAGRVRRHGWRPSGAAPRPIWSEPSPSGWSTPDERERVSADLVKVIRNAGTTVGTGFLATPFLLPVLADHGHLDVAFDLLLQTRPPSWLHMIEAGSTTVWENWEGPTKTALGRSTITAKVQSSPSCTSTSLVFVPSGASRPTGVSRSNPFWVVGSATRMPALTHHMGPLARRGSSRAKHSLWKSWRHPAPKLT